MTQTRKPAGQWVGHDHARKVTDMLTDKKVSVSTAFAIGQMFIRWQPEGQELQPRPSVLAMLDDAEWWAVELPCVYVPITRANRAESIRPATEQIWSIAGGRCLICNRVKEDHQ